MVPSDALLASVGLYPAIVRQVKLLHRRHGHALYRVECAQRSYILKLFAGAKPAPEVEAYDLLQGIGVPALPVHGRAHNALVLEDLANSEEWRLATEDDLARGEIGAALAGWYRALHAAGRRLLAEPRPDLPAFLRRETDALTPARVLYLGQALGTGSDRLWRLAAGNLEVLQESVRALPATLNYNDFHWTNLAISRDREPRGIVFDYHLLGIGMAFSDIRNVAGELGDAAHTAFRQSYGPTDEREAVLDAPLATLYALDVALQRPRLPGWAQPLVREIDEGVFEANLRRAIEEVH